MSDVDAAPPQAYLDRWWLAVGDSVSLMVSSKAEAAMPARRLRERAAELNLLQRDLSHLENISPPFARITYDEAIQRLQSLQSQCNDPEHKELLAIQWGNDFGAPHEAALTEMFTGPVFVTHYPTSVKAFYMTIVKDRPEVCYSADLLAPEGYGEIIGGSERILSLIHI